MATKGYSDYVAKFGDRIEAFDEMPYQISPASRTNPEAISGNDDLDVPFRDCVKHGRKITVREIVDALYKWPDGHYEFMSVKAKSYNDFMKAVSKLDVYL